ncbi:MAG: leucine--tRNA ligase [Thermoproteota archaeon]
MQKLNFHEIEEKWQKIWEENHVYEAEVDPAKEKFFATFPFPYMSGSVHIGTAYTLTRLDVVSRFKRHMGYNVLFPFAWHWTGVTIAGVSDRIKRRDPQTIRILRDIDGVPEETIYKFEDPFFMARYFTEKNREAIKKLGIGIDWRREFHTTSDDPCYSKYVEWQYFKLKEGGYIKRGKHPVVWCPRCKSVTGDHDRLSGEGVFPVTFNLIKYKLKDSDTFLVAATLRPETIFGITNVWLNPDADYVEAKVDGEKWVVSKSCVEKLRDQLKDVEVVSSFKGSLLLGRYVLTPLTEREVPILPASFVDPDLATGVVYSVPAHAPYDYMALVDLKKNKEELKKFNLNPSIVDSLQPIPLIKTDRFGVNPSEIIVKELGIQNQNDPNLEKATSEVYREEFLHGVLLENTGDFKGLQVKDAKVKVAEALKEKGFADEMLELPTPVVCRCGTRTHVKILSDQYLLNYSSKKWKEKAKLCLSRMQIFPEEARVNFEWFIDWYDDWAFVRTSGLGTKLPWDDKYLIETLSDSTVYMAYYIISKFVNQGFLKPSNLTLEFFDYVMLGRGNPKEVARSSNIEESLLERIRKEFDYWYPVDLRNSGKDLIANHLTFYIFHHVAIFPEDKWPKGVAVNGFMKLGGQPMHKSKGIFISIKDAIKKHGADVVRLACLISADGLDDPDWNNEVANSASQTLSNIYESFLMFSNTKISENDTALDLWLSSKVREHIKIATESLNKIEIRRAAVEIFFNFRNTIRRYLRRRQELTLTPTFRKVLNAWVVMMAPFTPHFAEEVWRILGNNSLVVKEKWPKEEDFAEDKLASLQEDYLDSLLSDIQNVKKLMKAKPNKIKIFIASEQKREVARFVALKFAEGKRDNEIIRETMLTFRERVSGISYKDLPKSVLRFIEKIRTMGVDTFMNALDKIKEDEFLMSASHFLKKDLELEEVKIIREDSVEATPYEKAKLSEPLRPSFILE